MLQLEIKQRTISRRRGMMEENKYVSVFRKKMKEEHQICNFQWKNELWISRSWVSKGN